MVAEKSVLELGAGQGLPGIVAAKLGASDVVLCDYNTEVIAGVTDKVVQLNELSGQVKTFAGAWKDTNLGKQFDVILMCETLYNLDYYEELIECIRRHAHENTKVLIGTKSHYYGLSGSFYSFEQFLKSYTFEGKIFSPESLEIKERINDLKSIERLIVEMDCSKVTAKEEVEQ